MSWNIELGLELDRAAHELTTNERLRDADLVLVQELDPEGAEGLARLLSMDLHYWAPAPHPKTGRPFGNAVLSPWPLTTTRHLPLPHTAPVNGQPRGATIATVDADGRPVTAVSLHVETVLLRLRRRLDQIQPIVDEIVREAPGAVVVGGDFNAASQRSLTGFDRHLASAELARVTTGSDIGSFDRFSRSFALDHIYVRGLTAKAAGVVPRTQASDHRPVWAELEQPAEEAGHAVDQGRR